jgi:hypothetical protein
MSKKSRRRNKRLLALAGLAGAVALSRRNKLANAKETNNPVGGVDQIAADSKKDTSKSDVVAAEAPKKIVNTSRSRMMRPNPKADGEAMGPNETRLYNEKNAMPNTAPPSIDNPYSSRVIKGRFGNSKKDGGRMGLKSGGKVKGCGIAKRGFGKAMKKGKR